MENRRLVSAVELEKIRIGIGELAVVLDLLSVLDPGPFKDVIQSIFGLCSRAALSLATEVDGLVSRLEIADASSEDAAQDPNAC